MKRELLAVPVTILLQKAGRCPIDRKTRQNDEGLCAGPFDVANRGTARILRNWFQTRRPHFGYAAHREKHRRRVRLRAWRSGLSCPGARNRASVSEQADPPGRSLSPGRLARCRRPGDRTEAYRGVG